MSEIVYVFHSLPQSDTPVLAGVFQYDFPRKRGEFRYVRSYLDRKDALPLSPVDLPSLSSNVILSPPGRNEGVFGVFRDALPDYWGRLVHASNNAIPLSDVTNIGLMRHPDPLRMGALDFSSESTIPESRAIQEVCRLEDLMQATQAILDGNEGSLDPEKRRLLLQGTSLGGARPKATVFHEGRLWLAKFPAKDDRYDHPRVEMALSDMARASGIETSNTRLISLADGRAVFLSERFDREPHPKKEGIFFRKGFISALTLLGLEEMENPLGSYPLITDEARKVGINCGPELYRRMLFNIAVRNSDDHLRNHGFIREGIRWKISPAYDLMPAPATPGVNTSFDLSIGVGKMGRRATLENALSEAARFGLGRSEAQEIFMAVSRVVKDWRDFYSTHGVSGIDAEKFSGSFSILAAKAFRDDVDLEDRDSRDENGGPE